MVQEAVRAKPPPTEDSQSEIRTDFFSDSEAESDGNSNGRGRRHPKKGDHEAMTPAVGEGNHSHVDEKTGRSPPEDVSSSSSIMIISRHKLREKKNSPPGTGADSRERSLDSSGVLASGVPLMLPSVRPSAPANRGLGCEGGHGAGRGDEGGGGVSRGEDDRSLSKSAGVEEGDAGRGGGGGGGVREAFGAVTSTGGGSNSGEQQAYKRVLDRYV